LGPSHTLREASLVYLQTPNRRLFFCRASLIARRCKKKTAPRRGRRSLVWWRRRESNPTFSRGLQWPLAPSSPSLTTKVTTVACQSESNRVSYHWIDSAFGLSWRLEGMRLGSLYSVRPPSSGTARPSLRR
jgi:hypothetical protein